jgi:hypothetical protein
MMMTIRRAGIVLSAGLLFLPLFLRGQERDYQSWYELELEYGFANGINLSGEIGQRFRDNFIQYDRTLLTISAGYDLNDYLEVGGGFRGLVRSNKEFELRTGYRVHADVELNPGWEQTSLSLRNRLQYGFDDFMLLHDLGENNLADRMRLQLRHRFFGSRFSLVGSLESWYAITGKSERKFYRIRYSGGLGYMIDFRSDLTFRYILENEINTSNPRLVHILLAGYSYSF